MVRRPFTVGLINKARYIGLTGPVKVYNVENQLATVQQLSQGNCPDPDVLATTNIAASWNFIYDGDGNRVRQEYFEGVFG